MDVMSEEIFIVVFFFQQKRLSLLMASALFQGASIGPLIDLAIAIDPRYDPAITFLDTSN